MCSPHVVVRHTTQIGWCAMCVSLFVDENENGLNLRPFFITIMGFVFLFIHLQTLLCKFVFNIHSLKSQSMCGWGGKVQGWTLNDRIMGKIEILSILFRGISCEEKITKKYV